MEENKYIPLSCSLFDELETYAVKKTIIELVYFDNANQKASTSCSIVDIFSKDKREYLKTNSGLTICLDKLISINGKDYQQKC